MAKSNGDISKKFNKNVKQILVNNEEIFQEDYWYENKYKDFVVAELYYPIAFVEFNVSESYLEDIEQLNKTVLGLISLNIPDKYIMKYLNIDEDTLNDCKIFLFDAGQLDSNYKINELGKENLNSTKAFKKEINDVKQYQIDPVTCEAVPFDMYAHDYELKFNILDDKGTNNRDKKFLIGNDFLTTRNKLEGKIKIDSKQFIESLKNRRVTNYNLCKIDNPRVVALGYLSVYAFIIEDMIYVFKKIGSDEFGLFSSFDIKILNKDDLRTLEGIKQASNDGYAGNSFIKSRKDFE